MLEPETVNQGLNLQGIMIQEYVSEDNNMDSGNLNEGWRTNGLEASVESRERVDTLVPT